MSLSVSPLKFLSDENVDKRLEIFLKQQGADIISKPKGLSNGKLAAFSKSEQRALVTNDKHFADSAKFPREKIFGIVWLRISQREIESSKRSFSKLLEDKSKPEDFEGFSIELSKDGSFESSPIPSKEDLTK